MTSEPLEFDYETREIHRKAALRELIRRDLIYITAQYESMTVEKLDGIDAALQEVNNWAATQDDHVKRAYEHWINTSKEYVSKARAAKIIAKDFPVPPFPHHAVDNA
jgi:hypothetical protein